MHLRNCGNLFNFTVFICFCSSFILLYSYLFILVYAYGWKTLRAFCFFFEYCSLSWGWVGVGGHVNVPCTSYRIYCHVAEISGIAYYVTCCYAAEISSVGWGWGWVGWGGMQTFLVLRTWYIAMLLRSLGSLTTWHVATLLRCHAIPAVLAVALWVPYWQLAVEDSFHTDGSLSRRRVLKKIWASTSDAHDVYLDLSKINRFCIHFFLTKIQLSKEFGRAFYIVNYRWLWLSWKQTIKTLARFPIRRVVYPYVSLSIVCFQVTH